MLHVYIPMLQLHYLWTVGWCCSGSCFRYDINVDVTTSVPLCFMLSIHSFIPYSFYHVLHEPLKWNRFIHTWEYKKPKARFYFFSAHVRLACEQCGKQCSFATKRCNEIRNTRKIKRKKERMGEMKKKTHVNLNTKYTINDSFNSIAWVNFQISFNIALKLCTSYSTGLSSGIAWQWDVCVHFFLILVPAAFCLALSHCFPPPPLIWCVHAYERFAQCALTSILRFM